MTLLSKVVRDTPLITFCFYCERCVQNICFFYYLLVVDSNISTKFDIKTNVRCMVHLVVIANFKMGRFRKLFFV